MADLGVGLPLRLALSPQAVRLKSGTPPPERMAVLGGPAGPPGVDGFIVLDPFEPIPPGTPDGIVILERVNPA